MLQGARPDELDRIPHELPLMKVSWDTEVEVRCINVRSHQVIKSWYYARKRLRRAEAEDSSEFLLSPGRIRGYDVATRTVVKNTLIVDGSLRVKTNNSPIGLEFITGKAATMLIKLSACHTLAKAIVDWNSLV